MHQVLESLVQAKLASSEQLQLDSNDSLNHLRVATETEGFLVSDIKDLVDRAVGKAAIRCSELRGEGVSPSISSLPLRAHSDPCSALTHLSRTSVWRPKTLRLPCRILYPFLSRMSSYSHRQ